MDVQGTLSENVHSILLSCGKTRKKDRRPPPSSPLSVLLTVDSYQKCFGPKDGDRDPILFCQRGDRNCYYFLISKNQFKIYISIIFHDILNRKNHCGDKIKLNLFYFKLFSLFYRTILSRSLPERFFVRMSLIYL